MEKRWRCMVCGYIHTGNEPPEACPVCGVDASKFEPVEEEIAVEAAPQSESGALGLAREMWDTFVLHAVAAHFPNGLLPAAMLFFLLFLVRGGESMEATAYHLVFFSVVVTPVVFISGIRDWQYKYGGARGGVFQKKIMLALVLLILGIAAVVLRSYAESWSGLEGWGQIIYVLLVAGMLGCVTMLGHYGGQLVFTKHEK